MRPNKATTPGQVGVATDRKTMRPIKATPGLVLKVTDRMVMHLRGGIPDLADKAKEMRANHHKGGMGEMEVMAGITSVEGTISNRKGGFYGIGRVQGKMGQVV